VGLGKYIKKAFLFHWNLLALAGGMGFALLSGHPDVFVPLVMAAEAAYLGFFGTHPRFQRHIDAQDHKAARTQAYAETVERLMRSLPPSQLRRFQELKARCLAVRQIGEQLREPDDASAMRSLDELQLSDLDRLLWIYLRTLYTQHMLERFLENTSGREIQEEIKRLEDRIRRLDKEPESPNRARLRQSLQANVETGKGRLANLEKVRENYELLQAETENLETKIQSITELAISRGDAQAITGQVEEITKGLVRTEQAINDLGFATGVESFDLTVPNILSREVSGETQLEEETQPPPRRRQDEIHFQ
jgi:hypothetical protein